MAITVLLFCRSLFEQRFYLLLKLLWQQDADDNIPNSSIRANHDRNWQLFVFSKEQFRLVGSETNRVIHLCFLNESAHFRKLLRRIRHANDLQPSTSILALQSN